MNKRIKLLILAAIVSLFSACMGGRTQNYEGEGESVGLKYAALLKIDIVDGNRIATILNPWDTSKVFDR